ncbi:MAG: type II/IV secretion system ATPase subunit [Nanoarchaeota archaeon]|nr:type II/IV secretion system ATPase subunit [Nanoarchaeota archaeon]
MADNMFDYDVVREGDEVIVKINCESYNKVPSIEDDAVLMSKAVDALMETTGATKIVFHQKRNYEYDYSQTRLLIEVARVYSEISKRKDLLAYNAFVYDPSCARYTSSLFTEVKHIVTDVFKGDPIGGYVELRRLARDIHIMEEKPVDITAKRCYENVIKIVSIIISMMEGMLIITRAAPTLAGYKVGERDSYKKLFAATIKPDFMYTKLMSRYPLDADEIDAYKVGDTEITVFNLPDTISPLYHMVPPEFKLSEDQYNILDMARKIMAEHKPKRSEFVEPERMRQVFQNIGEDLIQELIDRHRVKMSLKEVKQLSEILVRYTVGFGLIEVLLKDEKVQDVSINSPMGEIPIFIVHGEHGDCQTNIIPTPPEAESWASKLRMISGRPLDEANPILDTELELPGARTRVAVISEPLNPNGMGFSFRRHRDKPWTLPLFIHYRMINSLAAGILSFLVDGSRTMLIAGTRSAGKSSLLGGIMTEIMRMYRIITIEDTLELPTGALRKMGYNIQPMKVASAMSKGSSEIPADEGIRTTLRLGDSSLIVGEVRSTEARALYEAMRVGALANVVAGTIHGDSPYDVFDRVVNDLGVPKTSFKATDIIVVANPIRSADGLHKWRRVTAITEVRKLWNEDPLLEGGFVDLMKYETATDQLEPSNDLMNGDSEILKSIAGKVKDWAGDWDAVWDNIQLRANLKQTLVDFAIKSKNLNLMEADFVIRANDEFHRISDRVKNEVGSLDSKRIFFDWNEWLKRSYKKMSLR